MYAIRSYYAKTKLNDAERKEGKKLFSLDEDAFLEKTKSKMAALKAELEKVTDISDSLRSLEDRAIKMGYLHALNFYPEYYSYFVITSYSIHYTKLYDTLVLSIQASASVYSQMTKMNMALKNTSLEEVIEVIRHQSDFRFLYNHEEIRNNFV